MPGESPTSKVLPNPCSCAVGKTKPTLICASTKDVTISSDSKSLNVKASYSFTNEELTLSFNRTGLFGSFDIQSLDLDYDFANYKVAEDKFVYKDPTRYVVSLKNVPRHVFYKQFTCKVCYRLNELPGKFFIEFYIEVPLMQSSTQIMLEKQRNYAVPKKIETLFEGDKAELVSHIKSLHLDLIGSFRHALYIEDLTARKEMSEYKLLNVQLKSIHHDPDTRLEKFRFKVVNIKFLPPNVLDSSLRFIPMKAKNRNRDEEEIKSNQGLATVDRKYDEEGDTWIEFSTYQKSGIDEILDTKLRYEVRFIPNNVTFQACMKALESIDKDKLKGYFDDFDRVDWARSKKLWRFFEKDDFVWQNKNIASNEEQMAAIRKIVNQSSFPSPYCLFGPPGTGKTSCIVECILQIMKLKPGSKILVTAQSNSACNEIGDRLLNFTSINNVFRLYSARLQYSNPSALSPKLLPSSNLRDSKSNFPTLEELKHFSVVITTVASSSQLDRASLQNYFDYIFIDECAATTEPEALIPIVGLGFDDGKVKASIILAGDPKQLPPVINSPIAEDLGLNVSLMERVMTKPFYKAKPQYDANFITQLRDNYRSHAKILHFSNVEFYGSTLRAKNQSDEVKLGTKWKHLPNQQFPILFHNEKCASKIEKTSSFNQGEIKVVKRYVEELLKNGIAKKKIEPQDIGVISPYKAQSEKLKLVLPEGVEVGTTENYQGREKFIIIISTVKSKCGIRFLGDPRRLNVCLTRAKALMIIVGNADTLKKNKLWRRFVAYCEDNKALKKDGKNKQQPAAKTKSKKKNKKALAVKVPTITLDDDDDDVEKGSCDISEAIETDSIIDDIESDRSDLDEAIIKDFSNVNFDGI